MRKEYRESNEGVGRTKVMRVRRSNEDVGLDEYEESEEVYK